MNAFGSGFLIATLLLTLTGCGQQAQQSSEPSSEPSPSAIETMDPVAPAFVIPRSCDLPDMLSTIEGLGFDGAVDVTPPWDPASGTDLKLAIDGGGIACAWGPPNTDGGVVVYWVPVTDELWAEASALWESEDLYSLDVPDLDEDAAYFTYLPQSANNEFARWELNVRVDSLWIQVGTSSWVNPADGNAVVEAALQVATP